MRNALLEEGPYEVLFLTCKSVAQQRVWDKIVKPNCRTKLAYKSTLEECHPKMSVKSIRQGLVACVFVCV